MLRAVPFHKQALSKMAVFSQAITTSSYYPVAIGPSSENHRMQCTLRFKGDPAPIWDRSYMNILFKFFISFICCGGTGILWRVQKSAPPSSL